MTQHILRAPWRSLLTWGARTLHWLRDVPIADAIDRRNAPTMQLLFAVMGITLPISWARHFASFDIPAPVLTVAAMDMVTALLAFVGIVMIRRGVFRLAVCLFLASILLGLFISYATLGYQMLAVDQTSQMLSLAIGGLVLGRRALWTVLLVLLGVVCTGFAADAVMLERAGQSSSLAFHYLPSAVFSYFVIVLVLDRCVTALRDSLREAESRGRALQREIDERERVQARLLHAQKMETVGRLTSGIAHDFNNILGVVIGYTDARHRIDDIDDDPHEIARDMAESLGGIEASALKGIEIARRLLCFGRQDASRPILLDAGRLLSDVQPMLRRWLPRAIALELDIDPVALPIHIDQGQLELVVLDIVSNARDAMPQGGALRVSARLQGTHVDITFTDTGYGMTAEQVSRAFEPFYSTKPAGSGTGLGLAAAHSVVERARGTVRIDSAPGRGTSVCIRLPVATTPVAADQVTT
jgi:signal transduction histidine kinase